MLVDQPFMVISRKFGRLSFGVRKQAGWTLKASKRSLKFAASAKNSIAFSTGDARGSHRVRCISCVLSLMENPILPGTQARAPRAEKLLNRPGNTSSNWRPEAKHPATCSEVSAAASGGISQHFINIEEGVHLRSQSPSVALTSCSSCNEGLLRQATWKKAEGDQALICFVLSPEGSMSQAI